MKFTLTQMISKHQNLMELMATVKMMMILVQIILIPQRQRLLASSCPNSAFPNLMEMFLIGEHFGSSSMSQYKEQLSDAEKLMYLKDALKDGPVEHVIQGLSTDGRHI